MKKKIVCHSDAGHAWFKVPLADVKASGAPITNFSYMDKEFAYLEEDWDITQFAMTLGGFDALKEKYDIVERYDGSRSPIRNLPRFQ